MKTKTKLIIGVIIVFLFFLIIGIYALSNQQQPISHYQGPERIEVYNEEYAPLQSFKFHVSGDGCFLIADISPLGGIGTAILYKSPGANQVLMDSVSSDSPADAGFRVDGGYDYEIKMSDSRGYLLVHYDENSILHAIPTVITKLN